ncbi:MAG: M3 family metallopeptidase [Myxococcales bacterium]|nr:M3 family metallopeptidase [Myxococcales bacterium]
MTLDNPLLSPTFPIPLDRVRPEHVVPAVTELLRAARARVAALVAAPGPRTFDTLLELGALAEPLGYAMRVVGHLEAVLTSEPLRAAHNEAQPRVAAFLSELWLDTGLWRAIEDYAATPEARALGGARARLLARTRAEFRRQGAALGAADKQRLGAIDARLAELALKFAQNAVDATAAYELYVTDEARLLGLPDAARAAARAGAEKKGRPGWRFTLQMPSYLPVMTYLDDRELRRELYRAASVRAAAPPFDNRPLVREMLALRAEKARLLGYGDWADYVTEDRMAGSGARVRRFLSDLEERSRPGFEREVGELHDYRRRLEGPDAPPLEAWDVGYYAEKLRRERYDFDDEALRPYFRADEVVAGLFEVARRLYGVRCEPWPEAPSYHPDVRAYRMLDESGAWIAAFYVDLYPRDEKQGGAWMMPLLNHAPVDAPGMKNVAALVANLTPPVGATPSRLGQQEVRTLFHEFGHLLHQCLTRAELLVQAGTQVAWDFVELPSQIMENFCYEKAALDLFARHETTGEPIADELVVRMRRARVFRAATNQLRQLGLSTLDQSLHTVFDPAKDGDPVGHARAIMERFSPTPLPAEHALVASFDHLFGQPVGYAAGYYSYKWAEVLDADAFRRFAGAGLLSREVGSAFRDAILARGDEDDPGALFRAFMGRDPDLGALLERLGLATSG